LCEWGRQAVKEREKINFMNDWFKFVCSFLYFYYSKMVEESLI
jgi:hypothetical protein